jgi:hypothetical protein
MLAEWYVTYSIWYWHAGWMVRHVPHMILTCWLNGMSRTAYDTDIVAEWYVTYSVWYCVYISSFLNFDLEGVAAWTPPSHSHLRAYLLWNSVFKVIYTCYGAFSTKLYFPRWLPAYFTRTLSQPCWLCKKVNRNTSVFESLLMCKNVRHSIYEKGCTPNISFARHYPDI